MARSHLHGSSYTGTPLARLSAPWLGCCLAALVPARGAFAVWSSPKGSRRGRNTCWRADLERSAPPNQSAGPHRVVVVAHSALWLSRIAVFRARSLLFPVHF